MTEWLQFGVAVVIGGAAAAVATRVGTRWAVRPMMDRLASLERVVLALSRAQARHVALHHPSEHEDAYGVDDDPLGAWVDSVADRLDPPGGDRS